LTDLPFGLGAIPSPPDARDYQLELDTAAALPSRFVSASMPPVANQGNTGRCVAFSSRGLKQWEEFRDGHGVLDLDAQWLYDRAQAVDGIPLPHEGTTCRAALSVLLKQGIPQTGKPATGQNRIAAYYAVPITVDALKRALVQSGPVLIASTWFNSWFRPVGGVLPAPSGGVAGGHARLLFGWDDSVAGGSWLVRNSWGKAWGVNGNSYDPYRYLLPAMHDAWRAVDVKGDKA
jgi:C1A family cysteine protease